MGFGSLMAALLQPSEMARESSGILRAEVDRYAASLAAEVTGMKAMAPADRAALGDAYTTRLAGVEAALASVNGFYQRFVARREVRRVVAVDHAAASNDPSMGYCNMHDLLIQFVRDWGSANDNVRQTHHELIMREVKAAAELIQEDIRSAQYAKGTARAAAARDEGLRALTPGDALCRLGYELATSGLFAHVESNEGSPLFADFGSFLLNCVEEPFRIHPHAGVWYNQDSVAGQFRSMAVPAPMPTEDAVKAKTFKLVVGGFEKLYAPAGARHQLFDVVVTSFFLDTIPGSITQALATLAALLPPGGVWINYGPLLYRATEYPKLSWEEVVALAKVRGFEILKDEHVIHAQYCERTEDSLHPTIYNPRLLVARRRLE